MGDVVQLVRTLERCPVTDCQHRIDQTSAVSSDRLHAVNSLDFLLVIAIRYNDALSNLRSVLASDPEN